MATDFTLQIGGDFTQLTRGLKKSKTDLKGMGNDATQAFRAPQAALSNLSTQLSNFGNVAKGALAGLVGVAGFKGLISNFMNYNSNLANAVQIQKYNVTELEALGGAMRRFGGDTNGAISSLNNLSQGLQQASLGTGSLLEMAKMYGIKIMKSNGQMMTSEELLRSLSKQLNTYSASTKQAIASQLGLDDALLRVIDSGNYDSLIAQQKKLNKTTADDLKIATEFESAWLDLKDTFASLAKQVSLVLLPPLTKLMKKITEMIQKFKAFQGDSVVGWGAIGMAVLPLLGKLGTVVEIFKSLIGFSGGLGTIASLFSTIGTVVSTIMSPMKLLMVAFFILYAVVDDLYAYFNGEESIFGDLAAQYPIVKTFLDGLGAVVGFIKTVIGEFFNFLANPSWDTFVEMIKNIVNAGVDLFMGFVNWLWEVIKAPFEWIGNQIAGAWDTVKGWFSSWWGDDDKKEAPQSPQPPQALGNTPTPVLTRPDLGTQGMSVDNSTTNNKVTITQNIRGGDPNEVGEKTQEAITIGLQQQQLRKTK